jgi:periplasmic divalent cation tolerance protein
MVAFVTCGSKDEARRIAEALILARLAACVNVLAPVDSCFRWDGRVNWQSEHLLIIKTTTDRIGEVRDRVLAQHSYDVPEFIAFRIDDGSPAYLEWIRDSIGPLN